MSASHALACSEADSAPLTELERHAWNLGELVREVAPRESPLGGGAFAVAEWLTLAAGLQEVRIDTTRFDESIFMCSQAADHGEAASAAVEQVQLELTRLLYLWSAYEALRRSAGATIGVGEGVSDREAREWLARHWNQAPPCHYRCALRGTAYLAATHPHYGGLARFLEASSDYPESVLGLRAATKLRHLLAHGEVVVPEPARSGGTPKHDRHLTRGCSRLLLFSLQMLIITLFEGCSLNVERMEGEDDWRQVPLERAVLEIGLRRLN